jgi:hypothetical protein
MIRNANVPTFQLNLVAKVEERADFKTSDAPYSLEIVPLERRGPFYNNTLMQKCSLCGLLLISHEILEELAMVSYPNKFY